MTIFVHGKMKRIRRPPQMDGLEIDEFIRRNADPLWLHQNEMWEYLEQNKERSIVEPRQPRPQDEDDDLPF